MLEKINASKDLKNLNLEQLNTLAAEIRQRILEVVSVNGGHLASSLGTVELTLALHYCLDLPKDKIVWDVGHQCYSHKILSGRNEDFADLRQYNGISGFPCKEESEYDPFTTGHSSTAVSLALGLACGRDSLPKDEQFKVAAVIGDGSLSGGLCFEGLNNAGHLKKDLIVVLNTNELSIAPNVGALSTYLNKLISLPIYNHFKDSLESFAASRIPKGSRLIKMANKFEEGLKGLFVPGMFFEELGFRYFGPFDGNNLDPLILNLKKVVNIKGPRLFHVVTKKGKGYLPSETDPIRFHSAGPFDLKTGKPLPKKDSNAKTFTEVFSEKLVALGKENQKIIAITAAMPEGTGLDKFRDSFPGRFFDVGIAEEHAVCFAAGLAKEGFKPVVAIYSTFLQRAYDQIIECIALQNLGVVLALDRSGLVGEDGATHQGIFDFNFLRHIPNLVVTAPANAPELEAMLKFAINSPHPVSIRYPKANCPRNQLPTQEIELGRAQAIKRGSDFSVIAIGSMVVPCLEAMNLLEKEGLRGNLINARFVKPLDTALLLKIAGETQHIFTVEDGIIEAGFGSAVMEAVNRPVIKLGVSAEFIPCGKRDLLLEKYGLTAEKIAGRIIKTLKNNG
ncbi:MAG: 1-deoxy-D-xylulose-5-phosphate synthase [Candidatus Omnitrophica bacterium]|nr:1-deoxy-D-xylulose-5-phosphate synthase [Candidatus Omnitrophota bacterium]